MNQYKKILVLNIIFFFYYIWQQILLWASLVDFYVIYKVFPKKTQILRTIKDISKILIYIDPKTNDY